jgi:general secretion pathway protein D
VIIEVEQKTRPGEIDPEYRDRVKDILIMKATGQVFANHSVWKRARNAYEDVLLKNPADEEAINALHILYVDLREAAKRRRQAQEAERMAEIEWKWIDPIPPRESYIDPSKRDGTTTDAKRESNIHTKLKTIIITKISFEDTPVTTVFGFLKNRSRELDTDGIGVNFVLLLRPPKPAADAPAKDKPADAKPAAKADDTWQEPTITIDMDNVPLGDVIRYICEGAGLRYKVEPSAVVILGPNVTRDNLELRFFPVDPRLSQDAK